MTVATARGLLLAMMDAPEGDEDDFNRWYNTEHMPERRALPGFLETRRWIAIEGQPKYVALYDLETPEVVRSEAYRNVNYGTGESEWTKRMLPRVRNMLRNVYEQIGPGAQSPQPYPREAGALLLNLMNVPEELEEEYNAWYDTEHLPLLTAVPGCLRARRFRALPAANEAPKSIQTGGSTTFPAAPKYLALYEITGPEIFDSPEWIAGRSTPWTKRVTSRVKDRIRNVYRPLWSPES
ncbi:MAG: hypothetical protein HY329_08220 [Chloroflexi bacterium]|nr:hypothetical protein [Chloroflexota bacterium]